MWIGKNRDDSWQKESCQFSPIVIQIKEGSIKAFVQNVDNKLQGSGSLPGIYHNLLKK